MLISMNNGGLQGLGMFGAVKCPAGCITAPAVKKPAPLKPAPKPVATLKPAPKPAAAPKPVTPAAAKKAVVATAPKPVQKTIAKVAAKKTGCTCKSMAGFGYMDPYTLDVSAEEMASMGSWLSSFMKSPAAGGILAAVGGAVGGSAGGIIGKIGSVLTPQQQGSSGTVTVPTTSLPGPPPTPAPKVKPKNAPKPAGFAIDGKTLAIAGVGTVGLLALFMLASRR